MKTTITMKTLFRLVLAASLILPVAGLAQAEDTKKAAPKAVAKKAAPKEPQFTPEQLQAKKELELIFSCEPGFDKYTVKQVEELLKIYGFKDEYQGEYQLKSPLTLFKRYGSAKALSVVFGASDGRAPLYSAYLLDDEKLYAKYDGEDGRIGKHLDLQIDSEGQSMSSCQKNKNVD
jgi:hypothetical protein